MDIDEEIEMLDASDENFKEQLDFAIWSTGDCSDYRNDRERPYNGQSWTDGGERGKTEVRGLTMRDIKDCLIMAMIDSSPAPREFYEEEYTKCWDFSNCDINGDGSDAIPTQYLLDNQDKFVHEKVKLGTWRPQDVYKLNLDEMSPIAICQNLTCRIEMMMGIFPNIDK